MVTKIPLWFLLIGIITTLLAGCDSSDENSSAPHPAVPIAESVDYLTHIQPIFNRRCIACHGCIASPCNLKLDSFSALERGALGLNPYSLHLKDYQRTDMNVVQTTEQWRNRGFYPVIQRQRGSNNEQGSVQSMLLQMVTAEPTRFFTPSSTVNL